MNPFPATARMTEPRLLDRLRHSLRTLHRSARTEKAYVPLACEEDIDGLLSESSQRHSARSGPVVYQAARFPTSPCRITRRLGDSIRSPRPAGLALAPNRPRREAPLPDSGGVG
jgi:hypothetical protein